MIQPVLRKGKCEWTLVLQRDASSREPEILMSYFRQRTLHPKIPSRPLSVIQLSHGTSQITAGDDISSVPLLSIRYIPLTMRAALLTALAVRLLSVLLLPQTMFQPDEYYQALEPAHRLVFGYGFLTWEWRDLPSALGSSPEGWWDEVVVQGRLRSWLWPGVFALVYKAIQMLGLENTAVFVSPAQVSHHTIR